MHIKIRNRRRTYNPQACFQQPGGLNNKTASKLKRQQAFRDYCASSRECNLPTADERSDLDENSSEHNTVGYESAPIQLTQCRFSGLATSSAKI